MARIKVVASWAAALLATACAVPSGPAAAAGGGASAKVTAAHSALSADVVTGVIDLASPGFGLVGLGTGPSTSGRARLMLTTNFGRTFTSIGPRTALQTEPDSIFVLDRRHIWFATFSVLSLRETLYRTSDGGRHWQAFAAPQHNVAGGSADTLDFINSRDGWLTDVIANAPAGYLYRTRDGGAHWRLLASVQPGKTHGPGVLPALGQVTFDRNGRTGWLGGGLFSAALFRTADGGRSWHKAPTSAPANSVFGLPAIFGRNLVEPVTIFRRHLLLNVSDDGGQIWRPVAAGNVAGRSCLGPMPASFPAPTVGWAAAFAGRHVVVFVTTGRGLWAAHTVPAPAPGDVCGPGSVTALNASQAWLVTPGPDNSNETRIYASGNGGKTWQRIDLTALRSA